MVHGHTHYLRSCKGKRLTHIHSLPDELLFEILVLLPADDIQRAAKIVCRKWNHMTRTHSFIYRHLQHSTHGLLIQDLCLKEKTVFVTLRQGRTEISELCTPEGIWSSCNGLILEQKANIFYISNPVTNQRLALPQFISETRCTLCCGIAYASASKVYKVVLTYMEKEVRGCAILTVGVDNYWRHVHTEHLSNRAKDSFWGSSPQISENFIHWLARSSEYVLTMNIETETITTSPVPNGHGKNFIIPVSSGKSLSIIVGPIHGSIEVWDMNSETGEWKNIFNLGFRKKKYKFQYCSTRWFEFKPRGWLKYPEVFLLQDFFQTGVCVAYDVRTQEIVDSFQLKPKVYFNNFILHRSSLVWLTSMLHGHADSAIHGHGDGDMAF